MKNSTLFTVSAALAIATGAALTALAATTTVSSLDNPNGTTTVAAGDTLIVTGPVTSTGDSTSTRFNKAGDGTLILKGANNTFKRIKHTAGTLVFDGGTSTVSGGSGVNVANDNMNVLLDGDETIVTGGGSFTVGAGTSGTQYAGFRSKYMVVTNGTVDVTALTGELLCNFINGGLPTRNSSGIVTIGKGGLFRARVMRHFQNVPSNLQDKFGFNIVDGGSLEITGQHGLRLDPGIGASARYGFLHFDGGTLVNSYASGDSYLPWVCSGSDAIGTWANCPITIGEKGATVRNSVNKTLRLKVPFKTGAAADGGLHLAGKYMVYLDADGCTFNGGLFMDSTEGLIVAPAYDGALGAVPTEPANAVFVRGSKTVLYGDTDIELATNRNVLVSAGRDFSVIAKTGKTLTIHGMINGEHADGVLPTTRLRTTYQWTNEIGQSWAVWKGGLVILDPGEGRTNNLGRLTVEGNTEIRSGTTIVNGTSLNGAAPVYVHGSGAADPTIGTLTVSGGELVVSPNSSAKYVQVGNQNGDYGLLDVCGGTLKTSGGEFMNALGAGLTVIRDGGVIDCGGGNFRMAQYMTDNPTVVRLATNGLLRCNQISLDMSKGTVATFLFDGGYLHPTVNNNSFCVSGNNAAWNNITFAVGPGGAGFEAESGNNVWLYRPLVSGVAAGETDGGLMVRGPDGTAVCLMTAMSYNGPTTIDTTLIQQRGGDNFLPAGTDIVLKNGGELSLWTYGNPARATAATLGGVSGTGTLKHLAAATFSGTFAPSIGGTIEFDSTPVSLSGTLRIDGDATGCGKVKFDQPQDISTLSLSVPDIATFNSRAAKSLYKIVDGNYTGTFSSVSGLNTDWGVRYKADGVYLMHNDAFMLIVR